MSGAIRSAAREANLVLRYAILVFWPGAYPPPHPQAATPPTMPNVGWTDTDRRTYIDEARRDMDAQRSDKQDIRARAQLLFTTVLALGGALTASFNDHHHLDWVAGTLYALAALMTVVGGLAAAGLITAASPIGAPNLVYLAQSEPGTVEERLTTAYASTRFQGAATVAVLVTVLRDVVLVVIVASMLLAAAHLSA